MVHHRRFYLRASRRLVLHFQRLAWVVGSTLAVSGFFGCRVEKVGVQPASPVSSQLGKAPDPVRPSSPPLTPLRSLLHGALSSAGLSKRGSPSESRSAGPGLHLLVGTATSGVPPIQLRELGEQVCSALVAGAEPVAAIASLLGRLECGFVPGREREALIADSRGRWGAAAGQGGGRSVAELAMQRWRAGHPVQLAFAGRSIDAEQSLSPHRDFRLDGGPPPFQCGYSEQAADAIDGSVAETLPVHPVHDAGVDVGLGDETTLSAVQGARDASVPSDGGIADSSSLEAPMSQMTTGSVFVFLKTAQGNFVGGLIGRSPASQEGNWAGNVASPNLRMVVGPLGIVLVDPAFARPGSADLSSAPSAYAALLAQGPGGEMAEDIAWMNAVGASSPGQSVRLFSDLNRPEVGCRVEVSP